MHHHKNAERRLLNVCSARSRKFRRLPLELSPTFPFTVVGGNATLIPKPVISRICGSVPFQEIPGIWLNWKALPSKHNPKPRKVPCQPDKPDWNARVNNVSHCSDFDTALWNYELFPGKIEGIGINLYALDPAEHPVTALDLDNCFDPNTNTLDPWASEIINACKTYTEVSPSGRGVRLFYDGMFEGAIAFEGAS